jgi:hypothetical protein
MVNTHSTHSWLGSFAGRLIQLRPRLSIGSAVQYAVMNIHEAADLDPHRAAEDFVSAKRPPDLVRPPRVARPADPDAVRCRSLAGSFFTGPAPGATRSLPAA